MKPKVLLTAILSIVLAGCMLRAKPKAALPPVAPKPPASPLPTPPPPAPLSIPQTNVALPKPQPLDPAALVMETKPPEPEPPSLPPTRPRRPAQVATPPATPPPPTVTPPPEPPRETFQEVVSPAESKRLIEQAQTRRKEVRQILDQLGRRTLTPAEKTVVATIQSFLTLSEEAEKHNDSRQAFAHADRAHILAKELQSGQ